MSSLWVLESYSVPPQLTVLHTGSKSINFYLHHHETPRLRSRWGSNLKLKKGDEVIVPSQTHVATAHAVKLTGATPVFCDIDYIC